MFCICFLGYYSILLRYYVIIAVKTSIYFFVSGIQEVKVFFKINEKENEYFKKSIRNRCFVQTASFESSSSLASQSESSSSQSQSSSSQSEESSSQSEESSSMMMSSSDEECKCETIISIIVYS